MLHDGSFIDDATRIFRALRYAGRLGFTLEAQTGRLLRGGLPYVATIGGERLRREIELILGERDAAGPTLEAAHAAGALQTVHPALHWNDAKSAALARAHELRVPLLPFGFALLASGAS